MTTSLAMTDEATASTGPLDATATSRILHPAQAEHSALATVTFQAAKLVVQHVPGTMNLKIHKCYRICRGECAPRIRIADVRFGLWIWVAIWAAGGFRWCVR